MSDHHECMQQCTNVQMRGEKATTAEQLCVEGAWKPYSPICIDFLVCGNQSTPQTV